MQAGVPDIRVDRSTGPANHVKSVIRELRNLGHEVRLLACLDNKVLASDDLNEYRRVVVRHLDSGPLRVAERVLRRIQFELRLPYVAFFDSLRFAYACRQELKGYDIFYERMGWMGLGGSLASRMMNVPLVYEVNGDHLSELKLLKMEPHGAQRWLSVFLIKNALRHVSFSVATGEGWKKKYIERWGVDEARVGVIENGTDILGLLNRRELRSFNPVEDGNIPLKIIYVGAFEPWHGLEILLKVIKKLVLQHISIHAVLVGSGTQGAELTGLISQLGLEEYVTLTGYLPVTDAAILLANADIGISPYCGRVEYSGLKLLDYKAAGLPTIASGLDGQPKVIEHGRTGIIVPPCDESKLLDAILCLAADRDLCRRMGQEARLDAEKCHSWHQTAVGLEAIFSQVKNLGK